MGSSNQNINLVNLKIGETTDKNALELFLPIVFCNNK